MLTSHISNVASVCLVTLFKHDTTMDILSGMFRLFSEQLFHKTPTEDCLEKVPDLFSKPLSLY